jgi:hypothetical protein
MFLVKDRKSFSFLERHAIKICEEKLLNILIVALDKT